MSIFDYLQTPSGIEITNALVLLIVSIAGYITYLTHRETTRTSAKLTDHIVETNNILRNGSQPPQDVVASQGGTPFGTVDPPQRTPR